MVEEVEPGSSAEVEPDQPAGQHGVEQRGLTGQVDAYSRHQHRAPPGGHR
jgi:hypothetical protein